MKTCPSCGGEVKGRSDKKYCSAACKSSDHYDKRVEKDKFYIEVDRQLKTNRKLLKKYNQTGYTILRKDVLLNEGFNPNFFTHYWKNHEGLLYLFVYDLGFADVSKDGKEKYVIVEWQEYMRKK